MSSKARIILTVILSVILFIWGYNYGFDSYVIDYDCPSNYDWNWSNDTPCSSRITDAVTYGLLFAFVGGMAFLIAIERIAEKKNWS